MNTTIEERKQKTRNNEKNVSSCVLSLIYKNNQGGIKN